MSEPDKTIVDPVVSLMTLGVPERTVKICVAIFSKARNPHEADIELGRKGYSADTLQLLMPVFRPLYQNDPEIKKQAQSQLVQAGFLPKIIDEFFLECGDCPESSYNLRHEDDTPPDTRDRFTGIASQVVFDTVRSYLGLTPQKPQP